MTTGLKRLFSSKTLLIAAFLLGLTGLAQAQQSPQTKSEDQKLSAIYSEHLATSVCKSDYIHKFRTKQLSPADRKQLGEHIGSACNCLYTQAAKKTTPENVTDYIMYIYGSPKDPMKASSDTMAYFTTPEFRTIAAVYGDNGVRKKCGFIN